MRNAMKLLFKRKPAEAVTSSCAWMGHSKEQKGIAVAIVTVTRDCGHSDKGTFTCSRHLQALHITGGVSEIAVPCAECGKVSVSRVTKVEDLDV